VTNLPRENVQDYCESRRWSRSRGASSSATPVPWLLTPPVSCVLEIHHAPTYYLPAADIAAESRLESGETTCKWRRLRANSRLVSIDHKVWREGECLFVRDAYYGSTYDGDKPSATAPYLGEIDDPVGYVVCDFAPK
jgi:hypothetical protein